MVRRQQTLKINHIPAQLTPIRPHHPSFRHRLFTSRTSATENHSPSESANSFTHSPPVIVPPLVSVMIVWLLETPLPPAALAPPTWPPIAPLFISVEMLQFEASTPFGPPAMEPLLVTVIAPLLLRTGPSVGVEMVWSDGTQARATSGATSAASAINEAPVSSAALGKPSFLGIVKANGSERRAHASLEVAQVLIGLMTRPP